LEQKKAIESQGLIVEGVRGNSIVYLNVRPRLEERVDLAIITVKTQDIRDCIDKSRDFLTGPTTILSTQNGVRADKLIEMMLGKENLISSIVMFGSTYFPYNRIVHNFEGNWLIGRPFGPNDEKVREVTEFLKIAFNAMEVEDILAMKWSKIFVNFSNCLPALAGKSMQETYSNLEICKLALRLLKEGFEVVDKLGIKLMSMPDFDIEKLKGLSMMPSDEAAPIYSGIMTNLSKDPLYGSILQSIQRGRPSEIDFINGEIANQAKLNNIEAKLNTRASELVHQVEITKKFLTFEEIISEMEKSAQLQKEDFF
ncbi:MAG TPA: ketopantoate reductase C-terminal domain-containing protein, partial [Candidatus Omnitrophota bacterium]|nr:ketopantoate reductase C-terminal domain-containing protein [Candidatus Omnitrophota bacterium]